jgi:predicted PurR-regulated permease PerM
MEASEQQSLSRVTDAAIHLILIAAILTLCFFVVKPFLVPVLWGIVLAVSISPLFEKVARRLGGRRKLTAVLLATVMLAILLLPSFLFLGSVTEGLVRGAEAASKGELRIPPPAESVATWPVIGGKLHTLWADAAENTTEFVAQHSHRLAAIGEKLASLGGGMLVGILQFAFAILLAVVFMTKAEGGVRAATALGTRLGGASGAEMVRTSAATIRSVAVGVLGIAAIQSLLAGIGMLVAGVPLAGLWTLLVLILAVVQLPPLLVLLPVSAWVFSTGSTTGGVVFLIFSIVVGTLDSLLKPLFLGRGVNVPMLAILIGAIGGMMFAGILGLFLGAVFLALGQQLYVIWARQGASAPPLTSGT